MRLGYQVGSTRVGVCSQDGAPVWGCQITAVTRTGAYSGRAPEAGRGILRQPELSPESYLWELRVSCFLIQGHT